MTSKKILGCFYFFCFFLWFFHPFFQVHLLFWLFFLPFPIIVSIFDVFKNNLIVNQIEKKMRFESLHIQTTISIQEMEIIFTKFFAIVCLPSFVPSIVTWFKIKITYHKKYIMETKIWNEIDLTYVVVVQIDI